MFSSYPINTLRFHRLLYFRRLWTQHGDSGDAWANGSWGGAGLNKLADPCPAAAVDTQLNQWTRCFAAFMVIFGTNRRCLSFSHELGAVRLQVNSWHLHCCSHLSCQQVEETSLCWDGRRGDGVNYHRGWVTLNATIWRQVSVKQTHNLSLTRFYLTDVNVTTHPRHPQCSEIQNKAWWWIIPLSNNIFSVFIPLTYERTKGTCPHVPVAGPPAQRSLSLASVATRSDLSRDTTLRSSNVGFCDWSKRLAPLESAAAVVGGECETVSSLNRSRVEAETLKLVKLFIGKVKLNGVTYTQILCLLCGRRS